MKLASQNGFTLLEVIIAITIMAFLSIYSSQAIRNAVVSKAKVQATIDRMNKVRGALDVMTGDINNALHYRDVAIELWNAAEKKRVDELNKEPEKKTEADKKAEEKEGKEGEEEKEKTEADKKAEEKKQKEKVEYKPREYKILTHFIGEKESIHFTSLANVRSVEDSKVSQQAEVGYFIKPCRNRINKRKRSQCLWRRLDPYIDDDVTEGGVETVILEDVQEFSLRYLGPKREEEWLEQWKTDENGDDITKAHFPYAVEITLKMHDKSKQTEKEVAITTVAAIKYPNNPKEKTAEEKAAEQKEQQEKANGTQPPTQPPTQ